MTQSMITQLPSWVRQLAAHAVFIGVVLGGWEVAVRHGLLNPLFVGQPSGIVRFLWEQLVLSPRLVEELGWTLLGTGCAFVLGSVSALCVGLVFVSTPSLERFLNPYFAAFNAMPRIALAPLFILWFGLGVASKVAIGFSLVFFIVLSGTVAGFRGMNTDHVVLTRTLGATPSQMFWLVMVPGAVPVIFSSLRLGLVYALLGVVAGEIIASEHGLGQTLAYLGSTFNMNGVIAILVLLALLGTLVTASITWVEKRLLHWQ